MTPLLAAQQYEPQSAQRFSCPALLGSMSAPLAGQQLELSQSASAQIPLPAGQERMSAASL